MPLKKAPKGASRKEFQAVVSFNISELAESDSNKPPGKRRSQKQRVAIAHEAARG